MKVDRDTAAGHRAAMLDAASRLFRRTGFDGVGVADIARAAGLTHGAFYGHFASKQDLAAECCRVSLHHAAARWRELAAAATLAGDDPLAVLVADYLSERHLDRLDGGCTLAALGAEAARSQPLRGAMADGAVALADVLRQVIAGRHQAADPAAVEQAALATLAALQGGVVLARALADDPARAIRVLDGARALAMRAADHLTDPTPRT